MVRFPIQASGEPLPPSLTLIRHVAIVKYMPLTRRTRPMVTGTQTDGNQGQPPPCGSAHSYEFASFKPLLFWCSQYALEAPNSRLRIGTHGSTYGARPIIRKFHARIRENLPPWCIRYWGGISASVTSGVPRQRNALYPEGECLVPEPLRRSGKDGGTAHRTRRMPRRQPTHGGYILIFGSFVCRSPTVLTAGVRVAMPVAGDK